MLGAYVAAFRSFVCGRDAVSKSEAAAGFWRAAVREPAHAFADALQQAIERTGDTLIGLRFAREIELGRFGLLGIVAAMAPNLHGALSTLVHCKPAMSRLGALRIEPGIKTVDLVWRPSPGMPACVGETVLSGWVHFARHMAIEAIPVERVALSWMNGNRREAVQDLLQAPVQAGLEHARLRIRREVLDAPSRFTSPALFARLSPWLQREARVLATDASGCLVQVRRTMLGLWQQTGEVSEVAVSRKMGVSRRSLQRCLALHSASFSEMRDTLRVVAGANALVSGGTRQMDIGGRLGFVEHSSFSRSMRAWIGAPPSVLSKWANQVREAGLASACG